jgi:hypothetical protein
MRSGIPSNLKHRCIDEINGLKNIVRARALDAYTRFITVRD